MVEEFVDIHSLGRVCTLLVILIIVGYFAGFVARMEDTRLPKCVMFGEMVGGAGCVGGQEKEWMRCFLDDL